MDDPRDGGSHSGLNTPTSAYLRSWKEVARYFGRQERTVRRWEKEEGLPIHRLQHRKSGSVYALPAELDAWRVQRMQRGVNVKEPLPPTASTPVTEPPAVEPPGRPTASPWRRLLWISVVVLPILMLGVWAIPGRHPREPQVPLPLTGDPGAQLQPRLSPDGKKIAYVWNGEAASNFDIYARTASPAAPVRLTTNPAPEHSPAWSPDGSLLAFVRQPSPTKALVVIISALGGNERTVAELETSTWQEWSRPGPSLTWSPDGKWLVAAGRRGSGSVDRLLRISVDTGRAEPLTSPPTHSMGDGSPAISPDGRFLAFSRRLSWGVCELWLMPIARDLTPGTPGERVNTNSPWNTSPVWVPGQEALIFSTGRMDAPHLSRVRLADLGRIERLAGIGDYGWHPTLAQTTDGNVRLAYTEHFESVNIWRQALNGESAVTPLISSPHWSYEPDYSPDGKRIAFISDRTGDNEIWVSDARGQNLRQWTFLKQPSLGAPHWSPDGRRIAFSLPGREGSSIYTVDAPGTPPVPVTGSYHCGYLAWSQDGASIYFSSNRSGSTQIWKIPREGGQAVQATRAGGRVPDNSGDGRFLYYLKLVNVAGANDLFRMDVGSGAEEKILEFVEAYSLTRAGIAFKFYQPGAEQPGPFLRYFRFAARQSAPLKEPSKPLRYGIAASPDGANVLYSQADYSVSELKIVEHFR